MNHRIKKIYFRQNFKHYTKFISQWKQNLRIASQYALVDLIHSTDTAIDIITTACADLASICYRNLFFTDSGCDDYDMFDFAKVPNKYRIVNSSCITQENAQIICNIFEDNIRIFEHIVNFRSEFQPLLDKNSGCNEVRFAITINMFKKAFDHDKAKANEMDP